jgi:hypothetical protein
MKNILLALFLICTISSAAQKKGYLGIEAGLNFIRYSSPAIGGHISGNGSVNQNILYGLQIGVVKFQELTGIYIPFQGRFTLLTAKDPKKISPLIFFEPGYGVYHHQENGVLTDGGFTIYTGAGLKFPSKTNNGGAFLSVGYSSFGFVVNEVKAPQNGVGIRFGIMM